MNLITKARIYTPYPIKKLIWFAIENIPKRYELPFQYWYCKLRAPLEEEMGLLKDLVGGGEVAIDIGANIGFYSYALSKICTRVEAFEPNPKCLDVLKAYNAKNIGTHNEGLSSQSGFLELHIPVVNGKEMAGHGSVNGLNIAHVSRKITVSKLDDYEFKQVSFIKIDVEGHELEVIRGAKDTLLREKPNLLIEIEQRHLSFPMNMIFDELVRLGYKGYFLYEGKLRSVSEFSDKLHQKTPLESGGNMKYVNNFIFRMM